MNGADRTFPLGFQNRAQFHDAAIELRDILKRIGVDDSLIGVRGSSVTGFSKEKGHAFNVDSDIDFFVVSDKFTGDLKTSGNIPGMAHPNKISKRYSEIQSLNMKWMDTLGYKVSVSGFKADHLPSQPLLLVN